jgi:NADH dehydrogenase/putative oxidoreductase
MSAQQALQERFAGTVETMALIFRVAESSAGPGLDLLIRLRLAQIFFVSGLLKAANWDTALYLAAEEYPVSWMDPVAAAYLGVAIELGGALLLAVGLATRLAALALLLLSGVIQLNYVALDANLFWMALLGWHLARGAGPLALDHLLRRGLADSALPLAAAAAHAADWTRRFIGPAYLCWLRGWSAAALLLAGPQADAWRAGPLFLPLTSAVVFPHALALVCALCLVSGLAARLAALALILALMLGQMADPRMSEDWYWLAVFGLLALHGPGPLSLDALIRAKLGRIFPQIAGKPAFSLEDLPRVVIVGGGFGGLACATALRMAKAQVTLIDRRNFHLFQPLLYQVATASLTPGDIAVPIRSLFRDDFNIRVLLGEVAGIDSRSREAILLGGERVAYDFLVLATGAAHSYFGRDEWAACAPGLKSVEDATEVRRRLLLAFERAEAEDAEEERRALLTFLIVGAGPTGVELAGAIAELARYGMEKDFRRFDPASARIILVQSAPRVLPTFPELLSEQALQSLARLGVEVFANSRVEQIDSEGVRVGGRRIAARTVFWAAGVAASAAARWLPAEADTAGRVKVGPDLSVPGFPGVYAVGDTALAHAWEGKPVPGLAPAAQQEGQYVARAIRAQLAGWSAPPPFAYRHLGSLATIGRKAAVADFGRLRLGGALAWWLWGAVHLAFLAGGRNRLSVMFDWFWAYLTFRSGTRLITGSGERLGPR